MPNGFEATVKLVTEVDYSSIEKINPNEVARRLSKAYGPITQKLFRDPFLQLSKEYAKANLKFLDRGAMRAYTKDLHSEFSKAAIQLSSARSKLEKDAGNQAAKHQERAAARRMKEIQKEYKQRVSKEESLLGRRKQVLERIEADQAKSFTEKYKGVATMLAGQIPGGGDLMDTWSKVSDSIEGFGDKLEVKGLKASADKLDVAAGKLGTAAKAMAVGGGALAAIFAGLVKLISAAMDEGAKLNKGILATSSAIDLGANNALTLEKNMAAVRNVVTDPSIMWSFRASAEENNKILNIMNQQGVTYSKLLSKQGDMTKAVKQAHVWSTLLGLSLDEAASMQATFMRDMHIDVEAADDAFASMAKGAQLSGFNVNRFTSMVSQATSGLALYNVRIEESAGLMVTLGKVFGDAAGDILKSVTQGFAGEDMLSRLKRIEIAGPKNVKKIFGEAAKRTVNSFAKKFADSAPALTRAFEKAGLDFKVDLSDEKGRKELVKTLKGLSPTAQAKVLSRVRGEMGTDIAIELKKLVSVSKGTSGNTYDMMLALDQLDFTGNLMMSLKQVAAVMEKPLHLLRGEELIAAQKAGNIAPEQLKLLQDISEYMHGNYAILQDELKLAQTSGLSGEALIKKQEELAEKYNAIITLTEDGYKIMTASYEEGLDDNGNVISKVIEGSAVKQAEDLISGQEEVIKKMVEKPLTRSEELAKEQIKKTEGIVDALKNLVSWPLTKIYNLLESWLVKTLGPLGKKIVEGAKEQADKLAAASTALSLIKTGLADQSDVFEKAITETSQKLLDATEDSTKATLKNQLKGLRAQKVALKNQMDAVAAMTVDDLMAEGGPEAFGIPTNIGQAKSAAYGFGKGMLGGAVKASLGAVSRTPAGRAVGAVRAMTSGGGGGGGGGLPSTIGDVDVTPEQITKLLAKAAQKTEGMVGGQTFEDIFGSVPGTSKAAAEKEKFASRTPASFLLKKVLRSKRNRKTGEVTTRMAPIRAGGKAGSVGTAFGAKSRPGHRHHRGEDLYVSPGTEVRLPFGAKHISTTKLSNDRASAVSLMIPGMGGLKLRIMHLRGVPDLTKNKGQLDPGTLLGKSYTSSRPGNVFEGNDPSHVHVEAVVGKGKTAEGKGIWGRKGNINPLAVADWSKFMPSLGKFNDFIMSGGAIHPIDSRDQVAVGAKPGGALDKMGGLGGGAQYNNNHFHIYGTSVDDVKRALREAGLLR